jgi:hypothetical protein
VAPELEINTGMKNLRVVSPVTNTLAAVVLRQKVLCIQSAKDSLKAMDEGVQDRDSSVPVQSRSYSSRTVTATATV